MARRRPTEEEPTGFVMTPMIDIVFQLIIFFMLVMDMSKHQLEPVVLPYASKAIKEKHVDESILIMNILADNPRTPRDEAGIVKINGKTFWKPEYGDDNNTLIAVFEQRRQMKKYQEIPGKDTWVNYPVLLRADRSTPFQHIQKILMIATKFGGVTKVQLAAKQEN